MRLVGGNGTHEGRVEMLFQGRWGTVCRNSWDIQDASVVCHQLGYHSAVAAFDTLTDVFGKGSGFIWLDEVSCNGSETKLIQCSSKGLGVHSCTHDQDAGVICLG